MDCCRGDISRCELELLEASQSIDDSEKGFMSTFKFRHGSVDVEIDRL